jgi:fatty acid desaturase
MFRHLPTPPPTDAPAPRPVSRPPAPPARPAPHVASADRIAPLQRELTERLGAGTVRALHREHLGLDLAATVLPVALLLANGAWIASGRLAWPIEALLVAVNGWLLTAIALVAHDVAVHRVRWGRTGSWLHAAVAFALVLAPGTGYARAHTRHHARLGSDEDAEAYKMRLDTPARRWWYATLPGVLQMTRTRAGGDGPSYLSVPASDVAGRRRLAAERALLAALVTGAAIVAWRVDARAVMLGWVLPLLVVAPALNAMRIVLEHAEADDASRAWLGTWYRCGWATRALFLADSGDCHIVHHVFPRIPFYHCPRAADLFAPWLAEQGVRERRSFRSLMKGWFVDGHGHRSVWPR